MLYISCFCAFIDLVARMRLSWIWSETLTMAPSQGPTTTLLHWRYHSLKKTAYSVTDQMDFFSPFGKKRETSVASPPLLPDPVMISLEDCALAMQKFHTMSTKLAGKYLKG